jgi:hypothetical protein
VTKKVLAVDARLGHGGCSVFGESSNMNPIWNFVKLSNEINLSMNLVVGLSAVRESLSELCGVPILIVDSDLSGSVRESCQVKEVAVV